VAGLSTNTNFTVGKDSAGNPLNWSQSTIQAEADVALLPGELVMWRAPTFTSGPPSSSTPLRVEKATNAANNGYLFCGAVVKGGAAGDVVTIATDIAYVRLGNVAVSAGGFVPVSATAGIGAASTASVVLPSAANYSIGRALQAQLDDFYGSGIDAALCVLIQHNQ
jgi:hypothetical protein